MTPSSWELAEISSVSVYAFVRTSSLTFPLSSLSLPFSYLCDRDVW